MSKPRYSRSRNPRNGVVYVYEVLESYYDKEKKQSRHRRVLIGKEDPITKEIIPTSGRGRPKSRDDSSQDGPVSTAESPNYKELYQKIKRENEIAARESSQVKKDLHEILVSYDKLLQSLKEFPSQIKEALSLLTRMHNRYGQ